METILIIKPSSMGDVVHTLPAVAAIGRRYPQARLRWLVNPEWQPLLEGNRYVSQSIVFPRRELGGVTRIGRQWKWLREMRAAYRSDLVVDFQGLLRSAIIGRVCRGGHLVGFAAAREGGRFFYDEAVPLEEGGRAIHSVDRYLRLAEAVGAERSSPLEWPLPEGAPPARFEESAPFILLHPFSRGAGKSLTEAEVVQFCETVDFPVVIAGRAESGTGEYDRLDHVENLLNHTSLSELIWLIRRARCVVSVDSGPMHIAAALRKPLLAIHTWSDPAKVGPYDPEAWVLREKMLFQMKDLNRPSAVFKPRTLPDLVAAARFVREQLG
ncbi:MAG TPA: glycosyltransferase family 9 protein [Chthoniobacteraceae bacterium]|nr:glycosyltransferase family 9 protein [Chthoniobacteraceae bacterium]